MGGHVAILMAVRDGARFLPEQLASIAGQRHPDWSLHASDDGSRDASVDILREFASVHPGRVSISEGPRAGPGRNFLSLLRDARIPDGSSVAWCDQDDVWLPHHLEAATCAGAGAAPVLSAARYRRTSADGTPGATSARLRYPVTFGNALVQNPLPGHTMVANPAGAAILRADVDAALAAGVPHHDWWTCLVLVGTGARIAFAEAPSVLYRQHEGNAVGARGTAPAALERLRMILDGRFADWLDRNAAALRGAGRLTGPNLALLERFEAWRARKGGAGELAAMGVHRQDRAGQAALHLAAKLGKM